MESLDDVLFRVEVVPAAAVIETAAGTRLIRAPTVQAIVDADHDRVVGVVGDGYRVVTNEQAFDWARRCGQAVFPYTTIDDWSVFAVDGPSTGSYCRIDVAHRETVFKFASRAPGISREAFGPFIRVTNSYNGQRALRFDIGLLRWMCTNGIIIVDDLVTFRFTHSKAALPQPPHFTVDQPRLNAWIDGFDAKIATLQERELAPADILELVLAVLRLRPPSSLDVAPHVAREWEAIRRHMQTLITRYVNEVGENAYAAFNVMTDFATRPKGCGSYAREVHTLQRRVGAWLPDFCALSRLPDFKMDEYLKALTTVAAAKSPDVGRVAARTVAS
jgi:hypothetical protein